MTLKLRARADGAAARHGHASDARFHRVEGDLDRLCDADSAARRSDTLRIG